MASTEMHNFQAQQPFQSTDILFLEATNQLPAYHAQYSTRNMSDSSDNDEPQGEQIRVSLTLAKEVTDRSMEIPSEPIAVPASVGRKGLAAVINHLLDRKVDDDEDKSDDENSDSDDDDSNKLPAIPFDFVLKENNRLLRSGVEREARRYGLSLEKPLDITYFPAQEAPELQSESETVPDWISCLSYTNEASSTYLCAAAYDGSLRVYQPQHEHGNDENNKVLLNPMATTKAAHKGPIKCLATMVDSSSKSILLASGAMDHTIFVHAFHPKAKSIQKQIKCQQGHKAAVGCLDFFPSTKLLASGDWDGTLALWNLKDATAEEEQATKKAKTSNKKNKSSKKTDQGSSMLSMTPQVVLLKAHSSQISGTSWGNLNKRINQQSNTLITGSWDHSVKVWDMERQENVLSLNGSRVVACLDTSHHSEGIVATGHPDCTIRLWDVRTSTQETSMVVSDKTFRPSHKAWVSAVQWSPNNPYHLASTSHDGTVKVWDIRSPIPLHTVRVFSKEEKGLCLAYGQHIDTEKDGDTRASLFLGGTDCVVKQFTTNG